MNLPGLPIPLRRTFGAIDRLIAIPIEVLGDKLEEKLKRNLDNHVDAVQKKRKQRGKQSTFEDVSVRTAIAIEDWSLSASAVDPSDDDLSAVWRAVLDAILDDESYGEEFLRIVKEAKPSDIRFFLTYYRFVDFIRGTDADARLSRLVNLGLCYRLWSRSLLIMFIMLAVLTSLGLITILTATRSLSGVEYVPGVVIILSCSALYWVLQAHRLTPVGKRFINLYEDYVGSKANSLKKDPF